MSVRGRSTSPHPLRDEDVEMDSPFDNNNDSNEKVDPNGVTKPDAKVVIVTNLTRSVVQEHLQTIFGFYGEIVKLDVPLFGRCSSSASNSSAAILVLGLTPWF